MCSETSPLCKSKHSKRQMVGRFENAVLTINADEGAFAGAEVAGVVLPQLV